MALLVGKSHQFVLNGGAITRSCAVDFARIHGASRQIVQNHAMGFGVGIHNVAGKLFRAGKIVRIGQGAERNRMFFAFLFFDS